MKNQSIFSEEIMNSNQSCLYMHTQGTTIKFELIIKVSKRRIDVYSAVLNSLTGMRKLSSIYDINEFQNYIKDPSHLRVNIQSKTLQVIKSANMKEQIITEIPLSYVNRAEKNLGEENIIIKCLSKNCFSAEDTKIFMKDIAMCLFEKKQELSQNQHQVQQLDKLIKEFKSRNEARDKKLEVWLTQIMQTFDARLEKHQTQFDTLHKNQTSIQQQVDLSRQDYQKELKEMSKNQIKLKQQLSELCKKNEEYEKQSNKRYSKQEKQINLLVDTIQNERYQQIIMQESLKNEINQQISEWKKSQNVQQMVTKMQTKWEKQFQQLYYDVMEQINRQEMKFQKNLQSLDKKYVGQIRNLCSNLDIKYNQINQAKRNQINMLKSIQQLDKRIQSYQSQMNKVGQNFDKKLHQLSQKSVSSDQNLNSYLKTLDQKLKQAQTRVDKIQIELSELRSRISQKIQSFSGQKKISPQPRTYTNMLSYPTLYQPTQYQLFQSKFDLSKWIDPNCHDYKLIKFNGNSMTAIDDADVFGRNKISGFYSFTAKFTKFDGVVALGVTDSRNRQAKGWRNWSYDSLWYQSDRFFKCRSYQTIEGQGFRQGEAVTLLVDTNKGIIQWKVGNQLRFSNSYQNLKDYMISWVPLVYIGYKDFVQISQ